MRERRRERLGGPREDGRGIGGMIRGGTGIKWGGGRVDLGEMESGDDTQHRMIGESEAIAAH